MVEARPTAGAAHTNRRGSFDVSDAAALDDGFSAERLSTGSMSFWFTAYTLACSQIGSTLVSVSVFVGGLGIWLGCGVASFLGFAAMLAIYFAQEVWLHARRSHLAAVARASKVEDGVAQVPAQGSPHAGVTHVPAGSSSPARKESGRLMYGDLVEYTLRMHLTDRTEESRKRIIYWVQVFTVAMQVVSLGGTAVSEVIQTGVNMFVMTGYQSPRFWAGLMGGAVMTPLTWLPSFESLSWLSLLAILAVIYTAATIVAEGIVVGVHPDKPIDNPTLVTAFLGLSDMVFIWGGLAMVPEVQSSMRNPKRLVGAFGVDLVYTLAVLLPTAVVGLWAYQNDVSSNILQQLPNGIATKLAAALLSVHMVIAFAVLLNTVMEAAERSCGLRRHAKMDPSDEELQLRSKPVSGASKAWLQCKRIVLRTAISLFCVFLALAFPFFSDVVGVISAISQTYLTFLAPPLMWLTLYQKDAWYGASKARRGSGSLLLPVVDTEADPGHGGVRYKGGCASRGLIIGAYTMMIVSVVLGLGLGTWASTRALVEDVNKWGIFSANK